MDETDKSNLPPRQASSSFAWRESSAFFLGLNGALFAFSAAATNLADSSAFKIVLVLISSISGLLALLFFTLHQKEGRITHRALTALVAAEKAKSQAEMAAREKSSALAMVSHEIRTPLNGILGMLALLEETNLNPAQRNYAAVAQSSARTLLSIVDEVLDTARTSALSKGMQAQSTNIVLLVEGVVELLSPRAHGKGIEISAHVDEAVPQVVEVDAGKLKQILFNLAGNAIKFTARGGVAIEASLSTRSLELTVRDTGIGMTDEELARLFGEFAQASEQTQQNFGGTGLGLAISRRLAKSMGGDISVSSAFGEGTQFTLRLPMVVAAKSNESRPALPLQNRHYVLAMPKGFTRSHLQETLRSLGALITVVSSAAALKRSLDDASRQKEFICSAAFFSTLRHWAVKAQTSRKAQATVWVMLRAEDRKNNEDLLIAPFAGYLLRPLRRSTLLAQLGSFDSAQLKRTSRAMQQQSSHAKVKLNGGRGLKILLAEDNQVNALLCLTMLRRMGHEVKMVTDGAEALKTLAGHEAIDIVLLDMEMPQRSGSDVARQVRTNPALKHRQMLPLLALTGNVREEDLKECFASGMSAHLAKPFDRHDLAEKIEQLTRRSRAA